MKLKCLRCQYDWFPRSDEKPKVCPRCKSYFWDKERKKRKTIKEFRGLLSAGGLTEIAR